ncbi:hypothetical protein [Mesoflavibacter sp. CH_XMU1422-2]|uniref:hypothetical protein n=1 Tax=Mesoflavibacter sp. CH_XMU1422-2 TaxID=3107770 RepID=UPI00300945AC
MISKKRLVIIFVLLSLLAVFYYFFPFSLEHIGYTNKIYAHRVNSKEKLEASLLYFKGIELDLVYDSKKDILDVNHPPTKSMQLNFNDYLSSLKGEKPRLWLDIKNLNIDNALLILNKLQVILNKLDYNYSNVLVESTRPESLSIFSKAGFKTSYYLPPNIYLKSKKEKDSIIQLILGKLNRDNNLGISTNYKDYNLLKDNFPITTKYIWALTPRVHLDQLKVRSILKDSTVSILIIRFRSIKGNR